MRLLIATLGLCLLLVGNAEARGRHHNRIWAPGYRHHLICHGMAGCQIMTTRHRHAHRYAAVAHDGRPRAWCGWYARQIVGGDPGPAYNLARNWAHWGRPASPGIGVVVVWPHHVGKITGRTGDGKWVVLSGNDGNRVRERPRSLARAIAFRA